MTPKTINNKPLLSVDNAKTIKGEKLGYKTYIMYMSPYKDNSLGKNVCAHASKGCAAACLVGSGLGGVYPKVREARRNRTEYFLRDRQRFLLQLDNEIVKAVRLNKDNSIITIRLNGTSDIPFEDLKVRNGKNIMELHPNIQFYDYTKNWRRFNKKLPKNYHLTFSRSEENDEQAMNILQKGHNVAMVFDKVPDIYKGYKVIDGDKNDLRFKDPKNVIVGLRYKKMTSKGADNQIAFSTGFAIKTI